MDWQVADVAAQRVVDLLVELAGGTADDAGTDVGTAPDAGDHRAAGRVPVGRGSASTSPRSRSPRLLVDLGGTVVRGERRTATPVTAPSWRTDLETKDDLTEEIARLVGYDKIPATLPVAPPGRGLTRVQQQRRRLIQALADAGLTEVLAYPFVSKAANDTFGVAEAGAPRPAVKLANPLSEEHGFLRTSILPGLIEVAKRNHSRGFRDLALFEAGLVFLPDGQLGTATIPPLGVKPATTRSWMPCTTACRTSRCTSASCSPARTRPRQPRHTPRAWDWADALDVARLMGDVLGVEVVVSQGAHQAFHPGRTAPLSLRSGEVVGYAGELHPKLLAELDMPARSVALEVNADALFEAAADVIVARHISTFPVATQDVALVVPADVPAGAVLDALREGAGKLLEDVALFDVYHGSGIEAGKKSLAFGLRFRADDRTLTADEASAAREAAVAVAAERFGAAPALSRLPPGQARPLRAQLAPMFSGRWAPTVLSTCSATGSG